MMSSLCRASKRSSLCNTYSACSLIFSIITCLLSTRICNAALFFFVCLSWLPLLSLWRGPRLLSRLRLHPLQWVQLLSPAEQLSPQYYHNPHPFPVVTPPPSAHVPSASLFCRFQTLSSFASTLYISHSTKQTRLNRYDINNLVNA